MTKDDVTKAVHQATSHYLKIWEESDLEDLSETIAETFASHGIALTCDELVKIYKLLFATIADRSAFVTIKALFDLGLLNQKLLD